MYTPICNKCLHMYTCGRIPHTLKSMYVSICVCMCIHVYTFVYVYIHTHNAYVHIYIYIYIHLYIWCSVARPSPPPPPPMVTPPLPALLCFLPRSLCGVGGGLFTCVTPPHRPVVRWWVLGYLTPAPPSSPPGGGLWVSGLVFNPFPPPCGVVVCVEFRA